MTQDREDRILLLGSGGLLGGAFADLLEDRPLTTAGRDFLQGANEKALAAMLDERAPALVINCAADVDAEGAEIDDSVAVAANVMLPRVIAQLCARRGIAMIQFSSTGCYGDWKDAPYREEDSLRPTTRHHASKAEGEVVVRSSGVEHLIVRTGWLYGGQARRPRNFVWQRLIEASRTTSLMTDGQQRGCPTWVRDVARQVMYAWGAGFRGTANVVAHGVATRADYVSAVVRAAGLPCEVVAGPAFHRRAPVSANEAAVNASLSDAGLDIMPEWEEGIREYVAELKDSAGWPSADNAKNTKSALA